MINWIRSGTLAFPVTRVVSVDLSDLSKLGQITLFLRSGERVVMVGPSAVDAIFRLSPHLVEGLDLRWARRAWAFHNLVAHPIMQLLSFIGKKELGLRVHDATVPWPKEPK